MSLTEEQLRELNEKRRKEGRRALSRDEVRSAPAPASTTSNNDALMQWLLIWQPMINASHSHSDAGQSSGHSSSSSGSSQSSYSSGSDYSSSSSSSDSSSSSSGGSFE